MVSASSSPSCYLPMSPLSCLLCGLRRLLVHRSARAASLFPNSDVAVRRPLPLSSSPCPSRGAVGGWGWRARPRHVRASRPSGTALDLASGRPNGMVPVPFQFPGADKRTPNSISSWLYSLSVPQTKWRRQQHKWRCMLRALTMIHSRRHEQWPRPWRGRRRKQRRTRTQPSPAMVTVRADVRCGEDSHGTCCCDCEVAAATTTTLVPRLCTGRLAVALTGAPTVAPIFLSTRKRPARVRGGQTTQ